MFSEFLGLIPKRERERTSGKWTVGRKCEVSKRRVRVCDGSANVPGSPSEGKREMSKQLFF